MNKKWLIPAIAGIALMASACGNNAAPNYTTPNKTTTQSTRHYTGTDGLHVRNYDGVGRGTTFGTGAGTMNGTNYGTNATGYGTRATGFGNYTGTGTSNYGTNGYTGTGTYGTNGYTGTGTGTYTGLGDGFRGFGMDGRNDGFRSFGTDGRFDGFRNNNYNAYTNGTRPYTAFPDGTRNQSIYQNAGTRTGMGTMGATGNGMPHMGYATTDRNVLRTTTNSNQVYVDRDALARAVGNVTASCPGVQRSTVLVTDEEIFVGLNTNGQNAAEAKKQARMNAMSVSPRYYKVYVTDNARDIQEITRVASLTNNTMGVRSVDGNQLNSLIKRMGGKTDAETTRGGKAGTTSKMNKGKNSPVGISNR